ncbi:MAG: hypothetical protein RSB82_01735 [Victivallaceae bacterium]
MTIRFVFCHGFGFNAHFWDPIAQYFSQEVCSFIDLGYFKRPMHLSELQETKIVGIGHSLGLLKLNRMYENFDCLIGLNGFTDFLGRDRVLRETRLRELNELRERFIKNPDRTLKSVYKRCGIPEFVDFCDFSDIDLNTALADIEFLKTKHDFSTVPTLIINSDNDTIVPFKIVEDNFLHRSNPYLRLDVMTNARHCLGFGKSSEVYTRIMSFLNEIFN